LRHADSNALHAAGVSGAISGTTGVSVNCLHPLHLLACIIATANKKGRSLGTGLSIAHILCLHVRLQPRIDCVGIIEKIAVIAETRSHDEYFLLHLHKYVNRPPATPPVLNIPQDSGKVRRMEGLDAKLVRAISACLFAALISVGAYIAFPIPGTPVPIVLQNMFILLAGMVLGPWWGLVSVVFYLALGAMGLPVFSGGTGGLARFAGPTGGYLIGYLPAVIIAGLIARAGRHRWYWNCAGALAGMAVVYFLGLLRLKTVLNIDWAKALATGMLPFIPGDLLKIAAAGLLTPSIMKALEHLSDSANSQ
jgi:biotin transport system substrate-specific component